MFSQSIDPFGFRNRPVVYHHPSGHRQSRPRPRQRQLSHDNSHHSRSSGGRSKRPSLRRTAEEEEELQRQRQSPQTPPPQTPLPQQLLWEERPRERVPSVVKATCSEEFRQADGGGDDVDVLREGDDEEAELMYRRLDLLSRLDNGNYDARYHGVDGGGPHANGHERTNSCPPLLTGFSCHDEEGEEYQEEELSDDDEKEGTRATRRRRDVPDAIPIPRRNDKVQAENSPWDDHDQEQEPDDRDLLLSSSLERDCSSSSSSFPPRTIVLRPDGRFYAMLDHRVGDRARGNDSTISSRSRPGLWARTRSSGGRRPGRDDRHHHRGHCVVDDDDISDCCIGECHDGVSAEGDTRQGRDRESSNDLRDEADENSTEDDEEAPPHIIALEDVSDDEDEEILELASVWRNRSPSRGQWIEPDDSFQSSEYS
eukprot:CAMPEP_0171345494 /NCGR_PEP_ID=MMETSP0878-20121228/21753_1 /TAXON_ID=67004 /ORGANISM="Thalassiosira weissflogii, Strain CCMP1336" /LENGTH=425 /DNA_ID=CAMNT_0011848913 /DNA_START=84 /DNA_END=1361 /DNA_ORIENTATION=-